MDLIWTYSPKLKRQPIKYKVNRECIEYLYKDSIKKASGDYKTWLYTDKEGAGILGNLVDRVVIIPENFELYFLDDIKFYVLEKHPNSFCLIDGDLILDSPLNISSDILGVEKHLNFENSYYKPYNEILDSEGIGNVVEFWDKSQDTFNIGLVHIPQNFPREEFLLTYNKVKSFYKLNIEPKYKFLENNICIEMSVCTYLLSLFVHHKNISYLYLDSTTRFNHYSGTYQKYKYCNDIISRTII